MGTCPIGARARLAARFVALLPRLERRAQAALRHVRCPAERAEAVAEAVAAAWADYISLPRSGRGLKSLFDRVAELSLRLPARAQL
jgi:hypothetical protein